MNITENISLARPHDAYFEQVFKVLPVALELLRAFLPPEQVAALNLDTLKLSPERFLSDDLREFYSDLVYTCQTLGNKPVRICLLLEHKSAPTGRRIYIQLGNYLRGIQEEDIRQKRPKFTLTIPILFYHGKKPWRTKPLREQYGVVPAALAGYVPHFDILKVDLQAMSDEDILAMRDIVLLRNILLVFKHIREGKYIRQHFRDLLIFVRENVSEEVRLGLFQVTFLYVQIASPLKKDDIMELAKTLPPKESRRAKTAYEQFVDEGIEKGFKKGIEKGIEQVIVAFLKKNPDWSDDQVAEYFDLPTGTIKKVRLVLGG
ncbi:MAG: Rpn family recombination-promoting nuclease/putative transposase [Saprospiraceae bacterium]|jgi:predicted transposase/invertase (TIGR01784 family)|nr:Rpn family recombination-promoting nuclease/putative transposase [Saprospiraceae bacterium]